MNKFPNSKLVYQSSASGGAFISFEKQNILLTNDDLDPDRYLNERESIRFLSIAKFAEIRASAVTVLLIEWNGAFPTCGHSFAKEITFG